MKTTFKGFVREMIPVLLGVLIALLINNWNEARKDNTYIAGFYASIKQELSDTDKEISEKTPNQSALLDSIAFYANDDQVSLLNIIESVGGISGPTIKLNYWNALSNSKIELIDYDKLAVLTSIEQGSELLTYKRNKLIDFLYSNVTNSGANEKMMLRLMVQELISTQLDIQRDIQKLMDM